MIVNHIFFSHNDGSPGLTYKNGCYTVAKYSHSYCPGHSKSIGHCGRCGTVSPCNNNACAQDQDNAWYETISWSCSSPCTKVYKYYLGCGYE